MSRGRELAKVGGTTQTISGISTFVGISTFASDVRIHGKLDVDGDISYDEMTSVNSKVTGVTTATDVQITRNLVVTGITTVTGAVDANGGATIDNIQIGVTGDNEIDTASGSLTIDSAGGTVTVDDNLTVTGNAVLNGTVDLGDATSDTISFVGRVDTDIVPSSDGAVDLGSSTLEFQDLHLDGTANIDALVADTAKVSDLTDNRVVIAGSAGELEDDANLTFNGTTLSVGVALDVDGHTDLDNVSISGVTTITGASTFTGAIDANGGASIDNIQIGVTGDNEIDTASGNLTLDSAGGTVAIDDNATVSGNLTVTGTTTMNGNIALGDATGDTITPTGRFNADIVPASDGAVDLGTSSLEFQDLHLDGTANIDALLADTAKIGDLTSGRVVLAGSSGELEDSGNLTFNGTVLAVTGNETVSGTFDVDGATTLDGLTVAEAATFSAGVTITGALDANGGASIDNVQIGVTGDNEIDTASGNLTIDSAGGTTTIDDAVTVTGNLTVSGNLQIDGSTTTVNTATMTVEDKNIVLGTGAANDAACDGSGITATSGDGNKTWNWVDSTDAWTSSEHINLASGKGYELNGTTVLSGTTLGSSIVTSSLTALGTITTGVWNGTAIGNDYIATITAPGKIALSSLDIDGGTDIGADLVDADEVIVDDGGGGTNRRSDMSRIKKYIFSAASGDATASDSGAITLAASGVSAGTVGSSTAIPILTIDAKGRVTATSTTAVDSTQVAQGNSSVAVTDTGTGSIVATIDGSTLATFAAAGITLSSGAFVGNLTGNVTGNVTGNTSGNAGTATALETARAIGGVNFDGTAAINLPGVNTSGNQDTSGNAATATVGTNVTVSANNTANETVYPVFVDGATGTQGCETDTALNYNPSTNTLTAGTFSGSLSGTASNAALLDSLDSSQFVRSDTADTITATLTARQITPQADSTYDLGTNSVRWANVYADDVRTGDLHLSNEHRGGNTIDGSWGHYQIQEGEDDLFIMNKRSGKKFRFVLEQV